MWAAIAAFTGSLALHEDELLTRTEYYKKYGRWPTQRGPTPRDRPPPSPNPPSKMYYKPPKAEVTKCPACGSHEFREWHNKTICSYCRCSPSHEQGVTYE